MEQQYVSAPPIYIHREQNLVQKTSAQINLFKILNTSASKVRVEFMTPSV